MSIISSLPPSHPTATLPMAMEESISSAQWLIAKWSCKSISATSPPTFLFVTNNQEARDYIHCVNGLRTIMDFYFSTHSPSPNTAVAHNLMQSAMKRLEMEFHHLLSINSDDFNAALTSCADGECDILSNPFAEDLKMIAHCMIRAGYGLELVRAYKSVRKNAVDEELVKLGFQRLRSLKLKGMGDGMLDQTVQAWIHAMFLAVGRVFNGERILCDHIFGGASDGLVESSFAETATEGANSVFLTGEAIASAKGMRSTEIIFRLMDMHNAIQEAIPLIESVFSFESTSSTQRQVLDLLFKLRHSIHANLEDFESSVRKHSTKPAVPGGGIHYLTQTAMDHIARLAGYTAVLSSIVTDHPSAAEKTRMPESFFDTSAASESPISIRFARLILVLLCKLDKIAETYRDISLSYLFLANNLHLVVERVRCTPSLLNLMGEAWVITHHKTAKKYASKYEFAAWHRVIKYVTLDESCASLSGKERLRKFKAAFEEAVRKQRSWTVVDGRMKEDLKASIARKVVSAYEACVDDLLKGDESTVVRLRPADLEIYISDLFRGVVDSSSSGSSSDSSSTSSRRMFFGR
uniref:Exocyst subunit Exo70 family protein n=1 Tax=Kalanchoe fedtschenkoi TaxID=63787 RepID=A0A7N0TM58_KALFE